MNIEKINEAFATGQIVEFHLSTVNCQPGNVIMRLKSTVGDELIEEFPIPNRRSVKPDASELAFGKMLATLEQRRVGHRYT